MKFLVGVSAAFGAGTLVGTVLGALLVEDKLKKEYAESSAALRRAYEASRIDAETPALTEDALIHIQRSPTEGVRLEGGTVDIRHDVADEVVSAGIVDIAVKQGNPYHDAVSPSTGVYASFAELEDEEYYEEDGRVKDQITMIFDDGVARFFNNGEEIEDAFERVGGTIVDDMRKAVGEGNPILYIRNNQTEVDYEIIFEQA